MVAEASAALQAAMRYRAEIEHAPQRIDEVFRAAAPAFPAYASPMAAAFASGTTS